MTPVYHYIPSPLDIDELAAKLPAGSKLNRDKLGYLITTILERSARSKDELEMYGYVALKSSYLKRFVPEYNHGLEFLDSHGVIDINESYFPGMRSRGYTIAPEYRTTVTAHEYQNRKFMYHVRKKLRSDHQESGLKPVPYLDKWYTDERFKLDYVRATELNTGDLTNKKGKRNENVNLNYIYDYTLRKMDNRDFIMGRDRTTGRYHNPLTGLKSVFRPAVQFGGESLVQIDVVNCQPYLAQVLFDEKRFTNLTSSLSKSSTPFTFPSSLSSIMIPETSQKTEYEDVNTFIEMVNSGEYYEQFSVLAKEHKNMDLTRSECKSATYTVFFSDNRFINPCVWKPEWDATLKRLFRDLFPNVYKRFAAIKRGNKPALAILLQNIESFLLIEVICRRIAKEKPHCPLYTIHDSISTTQEHVEYVKEVMSEEMEKYIGVVPKLKVEAW